MAKPTIKSLLWLLLAVVAFYWKIIFTSQFSMMTDPETVTQAYTWFHFWAESVRRGSWPLWDPYAFGGRSYVGEMQTAAFYPLHLIFALFPANRSGLLAGMCFSIGGFVGVVPWPYLMESSIWLPLQFLLLQGEFSSPTVKQHLAALRMLFDWLVPFHACAKNCRTLLTCRTLINGIPSRRTTYS